MIIFYDYVKYPERVACKLKTDTPPNVTRQNAFTYNAISVAVPDAVVSDSIERGFRMLQKKVRHAKVRSREMTLEPTYPTGNVRVEPIIRGGRARRVVFLS